MNPSSEPSPERLIAEQDWVRPLLQRLVRDEASAQDVLQSTWLRALRRPPHSPQGSPGWRSWFARVARDLALRDGQRAGARREREQSSARGERQPSSHEIAEREELRARIVAHVLALAEPYRSTLLLRYYEGLEPRAIARQQGVNGSTVRNRIARGLALLRERLQREQGQDWVSCCLAVLPLGSAKLLAAKASWVGWIAKGGVVAKKIEIATAAAVVVTAGAVWLAWPSKSGPETVRHDPAGVAALSKEGAAAAPAGASAAKEVPLDDAQSAAGERKAAQQRQPAEGADAAVAATGARVFGQVRDVRGEPIDNGGGNFQLRMHGEQVNVDVPILEFTFGKEDAQADKHAQDLSKQVERLDAVRATEIAVDMQKQANDELDNSVELGKALQRFVLAGSTRIVFADSEGCLFGVSTEADSSYSFEGLHAGHWRAIVTHDGKLSRREEFEIKEGEREHRLDITLDDALAVRVRMRTPDGRELGQAVAADPELSYRVVLAPVALRPGSAARFLPDGSDQTYTYGCGHYESRNNLDEKRREEIGDASGVLTLTEPPPLDVGLVVSGQLAARRSLSPGEDLVDFELSLDDLRRLFSTVSVRVLDVQTHLPIAGASVTIDGVRTLVEGPSEAFTADATQADQARLEEKRRLDESQPVTDAQGVVRIPWVLAGRHKLFVSARNYAAFSARVEVESGGSCELKPVEMTGVARISGHLLDAQGHPLSLSFQLVPLERFEETHESLAASSWNSDATGAFEVPGQRRERYVLRVVEGDSVMQPALVDATQGDVSGLELRLAAGQPVRIACSREPREGAELRISTASGLPVLERDLAGLQPSELLLAPGSYVAELVEGRRRTGRARFVVADAALRLVLGLE